MYKGYLESCFVRLKIFKEKIRNASDWPIEEYLHKFMLDPLFVTAEYWKKTDLLLE